LLEFFENQQLELDRTDRPDWSALQATLDGRPGPTQIAARQHVPVASRIAKYAVQSMFRLRQDWRLSIPKGAIYLNVAQHAFEHDRFFRWLNHRIDVKPVFMIHDLLPVQFPEFFPSGYSERFERRLRTMTRARAIVTTTAEVAQQISEYYRKTKLREVPVLIEPLPSPLESIPGLGGLEKTPPYFVAVSTIEPRKNHGLLIGVWRSLIRRYEVPPKLVLVGKRGWDSEQVFRELDHAPDLVGHILEVPSLPSAHLKTLMSNAVALLMPSFAEGYGLPIVEALSLRVPVICSDIAVFREVSQGQALFRSPIDGTGWLSAVEAMILPDAALRTELAGKANHFKTPSWSAYFRNVDSFLRSV
jgi:glycosyltransferase involved in cell wall biosynthesis